MAFIHINGWRVPVAKDSFNEEELNIGDIFSRNSAGALAGSFSTRKRRFNFQTTPISRTLAEWYRAWIEGRGQSWPFQGANDASGAGVRNTFATSITFSTSGGPISYSGGAGYVEVASASNFSVDMSNKLYMPSGWSPTDGWTFGVWRNSSASDLGGAGWRHYVLTGAVSYNQGTLNPVGVTQYRDGVAGSYSAGAWSQVSSVGNCVGLYGKTTGAANELKRYAYWWFLPFEISSYGTVLSTDVTTFINDIYADAQLYPFGSWPLVKLTGSLLTGSGGKALGGNIPLDVMCRVRSIQMINAKLPGQSSHDAANKILDITMEEA